MRIEPSDLLLAIDIQVDFCPGGALAVADGDAVVPLTNGLLDTFTQKVATQDWHPADHMSFAANHEGSQPFSEIEVAYGRQTLWPTHCVIGTTGAEFHPGLALDRFDLIIRKGFRASIDSYSAFFENDRTTATGLAGYLRDRGAKRLFLTGLATDYCVHFSAMDAKRLGFEVVVVEDACRAIDLGGSLARARAEWDAAGIAVTMSTALH
jgi:nicotinamidase/pyrazinamidase